MRPIYIDKTLDALFTRLIVKSRENANLWHNELAPLPRLFLLFGQKGSGMERAIEKLCELYKVSMTEILMTPNQSFSADEFANAIKSTGELLVIRKAQYLLHHHALFNQSNNINAAIKGFKFIIVVSEEFPQPNNNTFWAQFQMENIICMSIPNKDFHKSLLEYYITKWQSHWPHSKVALTTEDYEHLAIDCNFCTPRDVKCFIRKAFLQIIKVHPTIEQDVTRDFLESLMVNVDGIEGIYCITDRDPERVQRMFETGGGTGVTSAPSAKKRAKLEESIADIN